MSDALKLSSLYRQQDIFLILGISLAAKRPYLARWLPNVYFYFYDY